MCNKNVKLCHDLLSKKKWKGTGYSTYWIDAVIDIIKKQSGTGKMAQSLRGWILSIRVYAWTRQCAPAIPALGNQRQKNESLRFAGPANSMSSRFSERQYLQKSDGELIEEVLTSGFHVHTHMHAYRSRYMHAQMQF